MSNLHRELAPISASAWAEIEEEATRTFKRHVAGRRVVDVEGPGGVELSAVGTGHRTSIAPIADGVIVAVYFIVYQRVENYVLLPRVMTKAIDLSAPTVIVTLLIGSSLAGLAGALIALPIVAAIKVVVREVWLQDRTQPEAA